MAKTRRRTAHKPRPRKPRPSRETFIGFHAPGQVYEGRMRVVPATLLNAFGGLVGYNGDDPAEGEPEEFGG